MRAQRADRQDPRERNTIRRRDDSLWLSRDRKGAINALRTLLTTLGAKLCSSKQHLGSAFWLESILAFAAAFLAAVTLAFPQWIEVIFAADPDRSDGSFEWMLVVVLCLSASVFAALAWREIVRGFSEAHIAAALGPGTAKARIVAQSTVAGEKYENDYPISA